MKPRERSRIGLLGKRILLLEPDAAAGERLGQELQNCGAAVLGPASSAVAALELIYANLPDAAVLDAGLDAQTSYAVAEFLWRESVPFIFITADTTLGMPPEFQSRRVGQGATLREIAEMLFGRSVKRAYPADQRLPRRSLSERGRLP